MPHRTILIKKTPDDLALTAAEWITSSAQKSIAERGRFLIALSGGSTPEQAFLKLADPERRGSIDWEKVYVFFGDERFVPPDDPRSNLNMAARTLLSRVPIPYGHVFPMTTQAPTAREAAEAYSKKISGFFGIAEKSTPPPLDLILLGLGDDGHTASLFPGNPSLLVDNAWFTSSPPGTTPPPVDRITATLPFLNAAREALFLVAGEKKAAILHEVLENPQASSNYPAAMVRLGEGAITWLIDQAAAGKLQQTT